MIFVDTSFWVAAANVRDNHHADALALVRQHASETLVTSNHVRGETWTFLRRKLGHSRAVAFLDMLESDETDVVTVDSSHERKALDWLRRRDEREYSFVDATSFALMDSLGLTDVLAFDDDFAAAGFVELHRVL